MNFSIDDLRLVSYTDGFEYHSLTQKANIIFELNGFYYYIFDEIDKLFDIISMPQYLQEEWFHNNNIKEIFCDKKLMSPFDYKWPKFAKVHEDHFQKIQKMFPLLNIEEVIPKLKFIHLRRKNLIKQAISCLLYTSPSPRDRQKSRMPSSA